MILLILICFSCKLQAQSNEEQTYYRNLTEVLKNPQNVRILNLSGSKLTTLPGEIGQLQNLQKLKLYENQLTAIPKEIGKLQKLQTLNLKYNQLATLPEEIKQLKNLKKLYLHNNPLPSEKIERIRKLLPQCIIYFE